MGPQREAGDRELALGDVAVDLGQQLVDGAVSAPGQRGRHTLVAAEPMGDERVDHVGHMVHEAAVPRGQRGDRRLGVAQPGQAGQIQVQVAVGRTDDHCRAVHDVVTGEQQRILLDQPAQVVRGVARRVQRAEREVAPGSGAAQRPTLAGVLVRREALGRAEADDAGTGGRGQRASTRGMVDVGMGHDDGVDAAERGGRGHDGGGVRLVRRTGVHHHGVSLPDQIGVGPRAGHQAGVGGRQPAHAGCHLVEPARLRRRAEAEVGDGRDAHPVGRGPGAPSGPSTLARMETARTASLKSPSAPLSSGSGTGARS